MGYARELERWQNLAVDDPDLQKELADLMPDSVETEDRFYRELAFGTGGLRGVIGAGSNRINIYTVQKATQGLAAYILAAGLPRRVAVAHDSRIKSDLFAREAARVLAANGITAYLYPQLMPTPALSYAVRALECGSGINVTASHNPAKYNGYKVYGPDGCQITAEAADEIERLIAAADPFTGVKLADYADALADGGIKLIGDEVADAYLEAVLALRAEPHPTAPISVVYTPLNGAGLTCVSKVLTATGVTPIIVPEQQDPDGNFPTCPYPNPEEKEALALGLALAEKENADLLLATDPDCDRVGTAVRTADGYKLLSGNEIGVLLLDYLCRMKRERGNLPQRPVAISTIVSTDMADPVAEKYGVALWRVLTGFKFIGEQIALLEEQGRVSDYIFGFEESYGYLSGGHVRDKDAVNASLMICDMARYHKERGQTLADAIKALYDEHGYYRNSLRSLAFEGADGAAAMDALIKSLRKTPPTTVGGVEITVCIDYGNGLPEGPGQPALPPSDVLEYRLADGGKFIVRPSGTEPKMKLYFSVRGENDADADRRVKALEEAVLALLK